MNTVANGAESDQARLNAFYRPDQSPTPPQQPRRGEPTGASWHDHATWGAERRFHGVRGLVSSSARRFDLRRSVHH
jgi:hypothetical protein